MTDSIQHWDVYECQLPGRAKRTRHVVGRVGRNQDFVVTLAITHVHRATREVTTETGATYVFGGYVQGGVEVDTYFAWWRDKQCATDVVRVTSNVKASMLSKKEQK